MSFYKKSLDNVAIRNIYESRLQIQLYEAIKIIIVQNNRHPAFLKRQKESHWRLKVPGW